MNVLEISALLALILLFVTFAAPFLSLKLKSRFPRVEQPKVKLLRVAGRTIAEEDWSPEVLEQIKKDYFRPPAAKLHTMLVDITSTCPLSHGSLERIVILTRNPRISESISEGLPRLRTTLNCTECGKMSKTTGRSVVWQGAFETWDGAV